CGAPEQVREIGSVGHETTPTNALPNAAHGWQPRGKSQGIDACLVCDGERVVDDNKSFRAAFDLLECGRDIIRMSNFHFNGFDTKRVGRSLYLAHFQYRGGIASVGHDRDMSEIGEKLAHEFKPFPGKISRLERQAGNVSARSGQARGE